MEETIEDARDTLVQKLVAVASQRNVRLEVEFDDQDITVGDETIRLNGKTVIDGETDR